MGPEGIFGWHVEGWARVPLCSGDLRRWLWCSARGYLDEQRTACVGTPGLGRNVLSWAMLLAAVWRSSECAQLLATLYIAPFGRPRRQFCTCSPAARGLGICGRLRCIGLMSLAPQATRCARRVVRPTSALTRGSGDEYLLMPACMPLLALRSIGGDQLRCSAHLRVPRATSPARLLKRLCALATVGTFREQTSP